MSPEKWKETIGRVKDSFSIEDEGKEHLEDEGGVDIEYVVFSGPLGRIRLEHVTKPVILDKKTKYSNRIGAETMVDYVYSESEKSYLLNVYRWDEATDEWIELDAKKFDF
jgi:hypothetical protein